MRLRLASKTVIPHVRTKNPSRQTGCNVLPTIVLLIDLISHYDEILPPTLVRKKRESDSRPLPVRKRTRPVDLRVSRSRLSQSGGLEGGLDPQKLLEVQLERKEGRSRNASPNRVNGGPFKATELTLSAGGPTEPPQAVAPESALTPKALTFHQNPAGNDDDLPPRPNFVEPPPEFDGVEGKSPELASPPMGSPTKGNASPGAREPRPESPNPAPSGGGDLKRTVSTESNRLRGPRTARGPRPLSHIPGKPATTANPSDYAPRKKGGAAAAGVFSRRTQESDAEDDVVGK